MYTAGSALLLKTATQSFWNTYYNIPDPFDGLVDTQQSTQAIETRTWLGSAPMPEEWVSSDNAQAVPEYSYTAANKAWKAGVRVDKKLIKYEQWAEIAKLTANLGEKARAHKTSKLTALLAAGTTTVGPDGQFFFDTDHKWVGAPYQTNQDNDLTGTAATDTQPTDLEFATALRAMVDKLYAYKDDRGDPMVIPSDAPENLVVMVPPVYRSIANRVLRANSLTGPIGNDLQGTFTVRVNPFLTGVDQFFLLYAGSNHKPLIIQETGSLEFNDNLDGDEFRSNGTAVFDASWWGETVYGNWATAVSYIFT